PAALYTRSLHDALPIFAVFDELVRAGKVRAIGCSNHSAAQLKQTLDVSKTHNFVRYDCLQPHYNLVHRKEFEAELAGLCRAENRSEEHTSELQSRENLV